MGNLNLSPGPDRLAGHALLEWTDADHIGTHRSHILRVPLQRLRAVARQRISQKEAWNYSSTETFTGSAEGFEAVAEIRHDSHAESLVQAVAAGAREGWTLYPDASDPTFSYDVVVTHPTGEVTSSLDEHRGIFGREHTLEVRFRRTDGSAFGPELYTGLLFYLRAGQDLSRGTFSRNSTATYRDIDGILQTAAAGEIRNAHYTDDGVRSIRLEASRTNAYTRSEALDHADWTKTNTTISADATEAPDGATTMDKIVEDDTAAGSEHSVSQTLPALADDTDQSASAYGKDAERDWVAVRTTDKGGTTRTSWVNLSTGATGTTDAGHTVRILDSDANGSVRFSVTFNSASGATTPTVEWLLADADGSVSYDGDGTSGLHLWGMQYEEAASAPSSYMPTTDSAFTRSADSLPITYRHAPQEMTVYGKVEEAGTAFDGDTNRYWHIGGPGGESDPRFALWSGGTDGRLALVFDDGTFRSAIVDAASLSIGGTLEYIATLEKDGADWIFTLGVHVDGTEAGTDSETIGASLPTAWSAETLTVNGAPDDANIGYTAASHLLIAPGTRTLAECRALTRA